MSIIKKRVTQNQRSRNVTFLNLKKKRAREKGSKQQATSSHSYATIPLFWPHLLSLLLVAVVVMIIVMLLVRWFVKLFQILKN